MFFNTIPIYFFNFSIIFAMFIYREISIALCFPSFLLLLFNFTLHKFVNIIFISYSTLELSVVLCLQPTVPALHTPLATWASAPPYLWVVVKLPSIYPMPMSSFYVHYGASLMPTKHKAHSGQVLRLRVNFDDDDDDDETRPRRSNRKLVNRLCKFVLIFKRYDCVYSNIL